MKKLLLAACLTCISVPFALAQNSQGGNNNNPGQDNNNQGGPPKPRGGAPEMTGLGAALAGLASLGGYLIIRRRFSRQS